MADLLSERQIEDIQKAYKQIDTDSDGIILTSDLGPVLRLIGQNPTDSELQVKTASFKTSSVQIGSSAEGDAGAAVLAHSSQSDLDATRLK